jgi:hypothetical protein
MMYPVISNDSGSEYNDDSDTQEEQPIRYYQQQSINRDNTEENDIESVNNDTVENTDCLKEERDTTTLFLVGIFGYCCGGFILLIIICIRYINSRSQKLKQLAQASAGCLLGFTLGSLLVIPLIIACLYCQFGSSDRKICFDFTFAVWELIGKIFG